MAVHKGFFKNFTALTLFLVAAIFIADTLAQAQARSAILQTTGQSEGAFIDVLRDVLSDRGLDEEEIDEVVYAVGARLFPMTTYTTSKRAGWKRIPIQTRFAPFGTKLVPSRNRGDSQGPTLLRYGRSA